MTDDLVKRLREEEGYYLEGLAGEAADRIEQLEAALREIATGYETEWSNRTSPLPFDMANFLANLIYIARKALEEKKDD
jgi:hypothetical protein